MTDYAHHFSESNIPFGIASSSSHPQKSVATRFENTIIFLDELAKHSHLSTLHSSTIQTFSEPYLNPFIALPKSEHTETRRRIQALLSSQSILASSSCPLEQVTLHFPIQVGDFTDFSCSRDHVLNASEAVFGTRTLPPGFEHFPVGYHGRCSTIVVSGTDVIRPKGQYKNADGNVVFGETGRLDYELEIGAVTRQARALEPGESVGIEEADEWIFGVCLVNDWSARDIQSLEMTPLGPMNGKSFFTSISPWIITLDALSTFKVPAPPRNPDVELPGYLQDPDQKPSYDLSLKAELTPTGVENASVICESKFGDLYWTLRDLVAQQTINGCTLRTGDLLATGTVSGSTPESHGCLMEIAAKGGVNVLDAKGKKEKKICAIAGLGVGFGECVGKVVPRLKFNSRLEHGLTELDSDLNEVSLTP
ncbi:related to fumarylacetoacetate hydrolase family protein [Phialocephala subalpina]|uniref:Fumarylacetoacetase n=1 Tax=Phialocephala subalpina TaxID=576137 RepID=A0A1L7XA05_9HELO|nr:related to fumarylacetoacetate hydrolase family protein [Phialocephala subalpina]